MRGTAGSVPHGDYVQRRPRVSSRDQAPDAVRGVLRETTLDEVILVRDIVAQDLRSGA
jgi:hypothetical protein